MNKLLEQSGKTVMLDLLAKGWVEIHKTCAGEQLVEVGFNERDIRDGKFEI